MKRMLNRNMLTLLSALSLSTASSWAQSPAPAGNSVSTSTHDDDVYLMDPFTVTTDTPGYKALDTLGGSRVRTELADTPSSLTVVTSKLMQDLNVSNAQDLLVYTTNTEVAGTSGNYSGVSSRGFGVSSEGSRLVNPGNVNRSRGLTAMDNTRNYFQTEIPWDGYNISRVDISRGPNSFLFGVGSPSGISNYSTNQAFYSDQGSVEGHYGSYGSTRESLDYNKVILDNQLAVRVDLMNDRRLYKQQPAYNNSKREYADVRFDPKFFNTPSSHMKIEFNFENGKVDSNNPRELPPMDYISGYFDSTTNKKGYNPYTFNPNSANVDPSGSLWVTNEDMGYAWGSQATYWYDASTGKTLRTSQASSGGTRSDGTYLGGFNGYNMVNGSNSTVNVYHLYTTGFNHYAIASNYADSSKYPGAYDRTVTYIDKTLSDTSIFDFYNNLIDGPNKHEWQNWNTYNLNIVESLFNDRLSIQAVVTHEDYTSGQEGQLLSLTNPYISVDMDSYMFLYPSWQSGATTNSNVGRAFVGGTYGSGNETIYSHDNCQLTAAYSLRFSDFMEESLLTHILGHQEFTGLTGQYITNQEDRGFQLYRTDLAFAEATRLGEKVGDSNINWVAYLGSPMTGATSATGLHLSNLSTRLIPNSGPITMWDGTWTAGSGVNAADPWVNSTPTGDVTMTQADNPANYKGYRSYAATIQNWRDSDDLYTSGDKKRQTLTSSAFLYQGYFWDDAIIPSFGVRRDRVRQQGTEATKDATTNIVSMNYDLADEGVVMYTTSMSYGLALHTAPFFKGLYPKGMDVTFYYFHGDNQTPKVRYGIDGEQLPNEKGKTDDFSVQLDALDNRVSLRLSYFKTIDNNVSLSGQPLGSQAWLIDSLPCWTLGFAACGAAAASMPANALPSDLQSNSWLWSWATEHPDKALEIANAMKTDFANLFPQSYWDQYGIPVNVQAIKNGDWLHVLSNGSSPIPWNIANTHLIHGTSPIVDQDVESKGFELEATVRPFNNWDITFNASKVQARQTALGEDAANYLNGLAKLYLDTVVGDTPMWGNYNGPVKNQFMSGLWSPYLLQTALTGADQPEIRKWNFKLISNYTFNEGLIKGVNVGGAVRWASKQIVGYGIKEATVYGKDAWIADVDQPYYGSDDTHLDLWVGYQRKLNDKVDWRVQLNLRNVGETSHLVTVAVEPDGTVAQQRIADGMSYDLSMKFMF